MSLSRFIEISKSQGIAVALYKTIKFGPIIIVSKLGRLIFNINSKSYWDYRLLLNWSNAGGGQQTQDFAESLFENVNLSEVQFDTLLDFGCALGDSSGVFKKYCSPLDIYLWDVSSVGLNKALKRNKCFDVKRWNRSTKVDFVYCSNVIEHISDVESFVNQLVKASSKWVCVQGPYKEKHPDGVMITPNNPLGEHIWTIDDNFIEKFLNLSVFQSTKIFIGDAPLAWPNGKQFYFLGRLL